MQLVKNVYSITKNFPREEQFSLTSQLRRAAISVPLNIAEGSAKRTKRDFAQSIRIALGSLMEVTTCLEIAREQNYIAETTLSEIKSNIETLYFKLIGLDKSLTRNTENI